jgi:crotonobetainyl-CoA:carnitine CoA-transferase CaiB-like acyl-CoA transferase
MDAGKDTSLSPEGAFRPLAGIRVVNLGINLPAPAAAARLAAMGAHVTKVEPPAGDSMEAQGPGYYTALAAGQEVLVLDLKVPDDRKRLDGLLERCDVLLTSSRLAALARLGLAWQDLAGRFPRLLQVAVIGYPPPREQVPGHDLTYLAHLGLLSPPALPRTLIADLAGAERAVSAALALLLARGSGRPERYAEVSLSESAAAFAAPWRHGLTAEGGLLGGGFPAYGVYEARSGWVAVAALEPHFHEALRQALGVERLDRATLAEAFPARTPAEWEAWADARGLPLAAVRDGR